jgi:hypothetical protein
MQTTSKPDTLSITSIIMLYQSVITKTLCGAKNVQIQHSSLAGPTDELQIAPAHRLRATICEPHGNADIVRYRVGGDGALLVFL